MEPSDKPSIDDIWAEMQAEAENENHAPMKPTLFATSTAQSLGPDMAEQMVNLSTSSTNKTRSPPRGASSKHASPARSSCPKPSSPVCTHFQPPASPHADKDSDDECPSSEVKSQQQSSSPPATPSPSKHTAPPLTSLSATDTDSTSCNAGALVCSSTSSSPPPSSSSSSSLLLLDSDIAPPPSQLPPVIQRAIVSLTARAPSTRIQALSTLFKELLPSSSSSSCSLALVPKSSSSSSPPPFSLSPSSLITRLDIIKPVLLRFADPNERCRELALDIITGLLERAPTSGPVFPYLVPVMLTRIGYTDPEAPPVSRAEQQKQLADTERSEELCVRLARLVGLVGSKAGSDLGTFLPELCDMLETLLKHHAPEVLSAACQSCCDVATSAGHQAMMGLSTILLRAILPSLANRRAAVRIAAIQAVRTLVPLGGHEVIRDLTAYREHNVIPIRAFYEGETRVNRMAQLVKDPNPRVRMEFYSTMAQWMTKLTERYDYITLLLPYLISGLSDDQPTIRSLCLSVTDEMGQEYESDHKEDLKDRLYYGAKLEQAQGKHALLPEPFTSRPRLGARILISEQASRLLPPLLAEIASACWQTEPARLSLLAIKCLLVFWEEGCSTQAPTLIPSLARALEDKHLHQEAKVCLQLLAVHANPAGVLPAIADIPLSRPVLEIMASACPLSDNPYRAELQTQTPLIG